MTGCRYGAKNTLLKNYLGLAESAGAQIHPMTTVTKFAQRSDGLWEVRTRHTGRAVRRKKRTFKVGDRVKIRLTSMTGRVVELRGPLGPKGAQIYGVRYRGKPKPGYPEVREDQLELIPPKS